MTMTLDLHLAIPVLARTPAVIDVLLRGLPADWTTSNEGPDTWSAYDVVGHLIHADRTDWMTRVAHLLTHGDRTPFPPFDRFAHTRATSGSTLPELLDTFRDVRADSVRRLEALTLTAADLERVGQHPEFGQVTLGQLLATWVAHDFDHLVQINRVMGRQYAGAVGPWRQYLRIMGTA